MLNCHGYIYALSFYQVLEGWSIMKVILDIKDPHYFTLNVKKLFHEYWDFRSKNFHDV